MTWRLVLGVVYIQRWSLLNMTVMSSFLIGQRRWLGGVAVLVALVAGMKARDAVAMRELASLPISSRDLHRTEWLLSALVPIALLTVGRCLNVAWQAAWSDGAWTFHASGPRVLFEIVYFSLVSAWATRTPGTPSLSLSRLLFFIGVSTAVPFVVIPRLPLALDDVSLLLWICALGLLGLGLRPLFWPPSVYQRRSPIVVSEPPPLPARLRPPATQGWSSRLEGIWVPMRGVVGQAMVASIVMLAFLTVTQQFLGPVTIWWPFDSTMTDLRFLGTLGLPIMFLIGWCPSLAPWIGVLKRLPLSSRRAALLLSLAPTTMPIVFWAGLLIIHLLAAAQAPDALRLGQLSVFIGLVALIDALGTKSGSGTAKLAMGFPVFLAFTYGMEEHRALVEAVLAHPTLPIAGVLCLGIGWLVNLHTLTRSPGSARAFKIDRPTHTVGAR